MQYKKTLKINDLGIFNMAIISSQTIIFFAESKNFLSPHKLILFYQ